MDTKGTKFDASFFFNDLIRWRAWIEESRDRSQKSLEIARTKPAGAEHDSNFYMAQDGSVWTSYGDTWYELTRSTNAPFAQYTQASRFKHGKEEVRDGSVQSVEKPDGTRLVFVKRSWIENMAEDWGWQIKKPGSWPKPSPTSNYYESVLRLNEHGLQMAKVLLEKREQIGGWMEVYAKSQGELRASDRSMLDRDWDSMIEQFAPELKGVDVPDKGSLSCSLHMVLDQIALGRQVRTYMF